MIEEIEKIVYKACLSSQNPFGKTFWPTHILPVVKYAKQMAKILKADYEVVIIAAYLHDYDKIIKVGKDKDHHINGAKLARKILETKKYEEKKINLVCAAIYAHRGSVIIEKKTPEEITLASADAMAHIDQVVALLYRVYSRDNMDLQEGAQYVLAKLNRTWQKMHPEAQKIMQKKYDSAIIILESVIYER